MSRFSLSQFHQRRHPEESNVPSSCHNIPTAAEMARRSNLRQTIVSDTETHLRSYDIESDTSRNILSVLADREKRGTHHVVSVVRWKRFRNRKPITAGDRSPSTVLESPPRDSTTEPRGVPDKWPSSIRRVTYPLTISREIQSFAEFSSANRFHSSFLTHLGGDDIVDEDGNRPTSSRAVSTISVAFSNDGKTVASTHGDHTVKVSCCITGRLLQSLEGHPRTPWTVKYHPTNSELVASGCLGHQVRVWNWQRKVCLQLVRLEFAIISLAFHPSGDVLAIANGTKLHFWGLNSPSSRLVESDQKHMLRCVHFPPSGDSIIIGGANPIHDDPRRRRNGGSNGLSFYLRMWDFDLERALETPHNDMKDSIPFGITMGRRSISNVRLQSASMDGPYSNFVLQPRTFVPRALLYNDGGFDVSSDGKRLCVCAEYWLPDGVDNVMEQLHQEERIYEASMREKELLLHDDSYSSPERPMVSAADLNSDEHQSTPSNSLRINEQDDIITPKTPGNSSPETYGGFPQDNALPSGALNGSFVPTTPPISVEPRSHNLSPPPPPGRRPAGTGVLRHARESVNTSGGQPLPSGNAEHGDGRTASVPIGRYSRGARGISTPPPPPPHAPAATPMRPPHPLSIVSPSSISRQGSSPQNQLDFNANRGRYVPHIAVISIDPSPIPEADVDGRQLRNKPGALACGYQPRLGQLMEAIPLDANKATAVTCVKFSPTTDFCLIGYGVRQAGPETETGFHPVTAVYRIRGGMSHVSTMLSRDDDVNIARFHPDSGHGIVYGTKQGRVRVLSPRPWNFY